MKQTAHASVKLDEGEVKLMIVKLLHVEKLLKEMGVSSINFTGRVDQ